MFQTLFQVALGGAIGAALRHASVLGAARLFGTGFPLGTLVVNVAGSFLIGVLVVALVKTGGTRHAPFLMTGVLGGFTTFSAFSLDAVSLWQRGQDVLAASYVVASVALSLGALLLGLAMARVLWP